MRLKVTKVEEISRDQIVISVATKEGEEYLTVHRDSLDADSSIEIGRPVGRDGKNNRLLVELPVESDSGTWRVWVDRTAVDDGASLEAAE